MKVEPQKEHHWLQQLVGNWTYESEALMGPDQPLIKSSGTQTTRPIGSVWIMTEGTWEMPDGEVGTSVISLGFDTAKNRFVGTFLASMMAYLWIYDGALVGDVLTLDADGPSFGDPNKTARYQDIIEILSADHYTLSAQVLGEDGRWTRFMTTHYRRAK